MKDQNDLESLREKLAKISNAAPNGAHMNVAVKFQISTQYLYQIRSGKNKTVDSKENRQFIKKLIDEYIGLINQHVETIKNLTNSL